MSSTTYFLSAPRDKNLKTFGGALYALAKERQIVAASGAYGGTVPLPGAIFTNAPFAFICK